MHLDHVSFAAGPAGLEKTSEQLSELLGEEFVDGGDHPRFGTRNRVLPLTNGQYLEVVEVLDHPASDKAPFGQAVRARSESGGGWLGWVIAVDDITPIESRLHRPAVLGNRHRPDGVELRWRQIGVKGLQSDPQLPFFVQWETGADQHPSSNATGRVSLAGLEIAGDPHRVAEWIGVATTASIGGTDIQWVAPNGTPGVLAANFATADGVVRI
ncbi:MAG: VOC family protein [Propionibacteriales bacterium]|nr:VOC family protein [Propionibacteriales bacterium]